MTRQEGAQKHLILGSAICCKSPSEDQALTADRREGFLGKPSPKRALSCLGCQFPTLGQSPLSSVAGPRSPSGHGLLFVGEPRKLRFIALFLGGTANPEGGEAEAEARSAASAQASFPARRAREKTALIRRMGRGEIKARQQEKADRLPTPFKGRGPLC